jgi:hypothetical protein
MNILVHFQDLSPFLPVLALQLKIATVSFMQLSTERQAALCKNQAKS